jgi:hypothetical protein
MRRFNFAVLRPLVALLILGASFWVLSKYSSALSYSAWFGSGNPEFAVRQAIVSDSSYPTTISGHGNIDCDNLSFTRRTGIILPGIYSEDKVTGCFVSTSIGQVEGNGYVNVSGTDHVATITDQYGTPASYLTFPHSDIYISNASSAPNGAYIWLNSLQSAATFTHDLSGKIWAKFDPAGQKQLTDKAGNPLPVMGDNFAESENGQWLVVDSPGRGILRINAETGEALPFAPSFEYGNGVGAAIRLAISSDGQHAIVASKTYSYFIIFDLSTCAAVPSVITQPVACQSRDLNTFIRSKISDMGGVLYARFSTNNLLNIYASYNISTASAIGQFALAAPGTSLTGMDYIALGDSFSSGEGAFKYEVGTDEKGINLCHLSTVSYPYIIAQRLNFNSFHSVACSGAKTTNIGGGSGIDKDTIRADRDNQFDPTKIPINNSLGDWIPGYDKQLNFVKANTPHLITLSAIGNDLGFSDIIKSCTRPGTCYPNFEDQLEMFNAIDTKLPVLVSLYQKLKKADTDKTAQIYAVGYPSVALSTGNCGLNVHLNQAELVFAGNLTSRINQIVKTAAAQAGIHYANIEDALNGHRLCEGTAGIMGMNGLTAGGDILHVIGNESYHPTEFGQFLMAQAILGTINANSPSPAPQPASALPAIDHAKTGLAALPKTDRIINKKIIADKSTAVVKSSKATVKIPNFSHGLNPGNSYITTINGGSGTATLANPNGGLTSEVPIPADGLVHTINITGTDITGTPIDITIIVTADPPPSGNIELCTSGIDIDQDGIDDACDNIIGSAPTPITPPTTTTATVITATTPAVLISTSAITDSSPIKSVNNPNQAGSLNTPNNYESASGKATSITQNTASNGKVLGAITYQPSQLSSSLKRLAISAQTSIDIIATAHPLRFLSSTLASLLSLLILALFNIRSHKLDNIYIDITHHNLHVY